MRIRHLLHLQNLRTAETSDDQRFHAASVAVQQRRKFVASTSCDASIIELSFRPQLPQEYLAAEARVCGQNIVAARGCRWKRLCLPCLERKRSPGSLLPALLFRKVQHLALGIWHL